MMGKWGWGLLLRSSIGEQFLYCECSRVLSFELYWYMLVCFVLQIEFVCIVGVSWRGRLNLGVIIVFWVSIQGNEDLLFGIYLKE